MTTPILHQLSLLPCSAGPHSSGPSQRPSKPKPPPAPAPVPAVVELPLTVTCTPRRCPTAERRRRGDGLALGGRILVAPAPPGLSGISELMVFEPDGDGDWFERLPLHIPLRVVLRERARSRPDLIGKALPLDQQLQGTQIAVAGAQR